MKRSERQHLKENAFATWISEASETARDYRREITWALVALAVLIAAALGYHYWRGRVAEEADTALATALAMSEAAVVPPPAPGTPNATPPQPGMYASEQAKLEAVLPRFVAVADQYPSTRAATTALYQAAGTLLALGRYDEAATRYRQVEQQGTGTVYAEMAQLGLASVNMAQGHPDQAVAIYEKLVAAPDTQLPLDGLLIQMGRAYVKAGKTDEAARAYKRIVDEFPQSQYLADARQALQEMGQGRQS